jgi:hypothetical protein
MKDKQEFHQLLVRHQRSELQRICPHHRRLRLFALCGEIQPHSRRKARGTSVLFVVRVPQAVAEFPPHLTNTPIRRTALEDLLTRRMAEAIERTSAMITKAYPAAGSPLPCRARKFCPVPSLVVADEFVEARLTCNLPARTWPHPGRRCPGCFLPRTAGGRQQLPHLLQPGRARGRAFCGSDGGCGCGAAGPAHARHDQFCRRGLTPDPAGSLGSCRIWSATSSCRWRRPCASPWRFPMPAPSGHGHSFRHHGYPGRCLFGAARTDEGPGRRHL